LFDKLALLRASTDLAREVVPFAAVQPSNTPLKSRFQFSSVSV